MVCVCMCALQSGLVLKESRLPEDTARIYQESSELYSPTEANVASNRINDQDLEIATCLLVICIRLQGDQ